MTDTEQPRLVLPKIEQATFEDMQSELADHPQTLLQTVKESISPDDRSVFWGLSVAALELQRITNNLLLSMTEAGKTAMELQMHVVYGLLAQQIHKESIIDLLIDERPRLAGLPIVELGPSATQAVIRMGYLGKVLQNYDPYMARAIDGEIIRPRQEHERRAARVGCLMLYGLLNNAAQPHT